jgi:hypothetical protein
MQDLPYLNAYPAARQRRCDLARSNGFSLSEQAAAAIERTRRDVLTMSRKPKTAIFTLANLEID